MALTEQEIIKAHSDLDQGWAELATKRDQIFMILKRFLGKEPVDMKDEETQEREGQIMYQMTVVVHTELYLRSLN